MNQRSDAKASTDFTKISTNDTYIITPALKPSAAASTAPATPSPA